MMLNPTRAEAAGGPAEIGTDLIRRSFVGRSASGGGVAAGLA